MLSQMECPINGCRAGVTKVIKENDLTVNDTLDLVIVDENESYRHYANGLLVRLKNYSGYLQLPEHMPLAKFPEPK